MQPGFEFCSFCRTKHCCSMLLAKGELERAVMMPGEEVPIAEFLQRDAESFSYEVSEKNLRFIHAKKSGGCIFQDAAGRCEIYEVRPLDCQMFPFDITVIDGELWWVCLDHICGVPIGDMGQKVDQLEAMLNEKNVRVLEQFGGVKSRVFDNPNLTKIRPVDLSKFPNDVAVSKA